MRRMILTLCVVFAAMWSVGTLAATAEVGGVGVVNMQQIFRTSPQIKKINTALQTQFKARKDKILKLSKNLQSEVKNYQKNQSVLSKTKLTALRSQITKEEVTLRQAQAKFQQDLFAAQNKQMTSFMNQVRTVVSGIAKEKKLSVVLPKNGVLYSVGDLDITSMVLSKLK